MKLLLTTQVVDINHPVLGFMHGWITQLSEHFEEVHVICLQMGEHNLPAHVHVHSLEKEKSQSRLRYVLRFYYFIFHLDGKYDRVFSHMNPQYIVLGGWFWKIRGVRMFFWRNHAKMNWMTSVAAFFAERVFHTSPDACTSRFKHSVQMPVGINEKLFTPGLDVPDPGTVLFLGRLSHVKHPELFVDAAKLLSQFVCHSYGDDGSKDQSYKQELQVRAGKSVNFMGAVRNFETPALYHSHEIYVNLTQKGSMDKTVLEAAFCGSLVITTNTAFEKALPELSILREATPEALAERIQQISALSPVEKERFREETLTKSVEAHSLSSLVRLLVNYMGSGDVK